jgi:hypothetical protein
MLAAAVGVQAIAEGDVGAVVLGDDALGTIGDERRLRPVRLVELIVERAWGACGWERIMLVIGLVLKGEEAVRRIDRRSPSLWRLREHRL